MSEESRSPLAPAMVEVIKSGYAKACSKNFYSVSSMADVELRRERNAGIRQFISSLLPTQKLVKIYKMTLQREMTFGVRFVDEKDDTYVIVIDEPGRVIAKGQVDGAQMKWLD